MGEPGDRICSFEGDFLVAAGAEASREMLVVVLARGPVIE